MGEKTHNLTGDVDCPFSNAVNTKPPSIKLKKKQLPKEFKLLMLKSIN